jgi:hypothetical protein
MFNPEIDRVKDGICELASFKSCKKTTDCENYHGSCFECLYSRGKKYRENYYFKLWHQYLYFILKDTHIIPERPTEKEIFIYMIEFPILAKQLYEAMK